MHHHRSCGGRGFQLQGSFPHAGMDDGVQVGTRLWISEDDAGQRTAIQASVGGKHLFPETGDNRLESFGSQGHDVPGQDVSIDDDSTQSFQFPSHRRFARRNSARQSDPHETTGYYGTSRKVSSEASPVISGPSLSLNAMFAGSAR